MSLYYATSNDIRTLSLPNVNEVIKYVFVGPTCKKSSNKLLLYNNVKLLRHI